MDETTKAADTATGELERMNEALRAWYAAFSELGRQFGLHLGMHSSDAAALIQITSAENRGTPLTQTQLARRIGLTTPATSSLLNRLEDAGHIQRHRNTADRRVVTLRSTQAVHDEVDAFFRAVGEDVDEVTSTHPRELIVGFTRLVKDMTDVLNRHVDEMTSSQH